MNFDEKQKQLLTKIFDESTLSLQDARDIVASKSLFTTLTKSDIENDSTSDLLYAAGLFIPAFTVALNVYTAYDVVYQNAYEVFLNKYSKQIAKNIEGGSLSNEELKLILDNRLDFVDKNPFTQGDDYVEEIIKAIIKNPNSLSSELSAFIQSGNAFDIEAAKKVREILDTTGIQLKDLHYVALANATEYGLKESPTSQATVTNDRIPIATFDTVAEGNEEIAELKQSSITFTSNLGGGSTLNTTNVSSIDNDLFVKYYTNYITDVIRKGTQPLQVFQDQSKELANKIAEISFKEFENNRRKELFNRLAEANADGELTPEEAANALNEANAAAIEEASDSGLAGRINDSSSLSEAEIEKRQRFFQQCVLLVHMNNLKDFYSRDITNDKESTWHENGVYNDRFYMITDGQDNSTFVNTLIAPKGDTIKDFLNITPDIQAFLVPKIKLFKVFGNGDNLRQVEFVFRNNTYNNNYMSNLFSDSSNVTRGSGYGIKEVSFSFEGASPATAKNDIKFGIKLFFQDFKDFVTPFDTVDSKGKAAKARFVDLILFDQKDNPQVTNNQLRQQYDPQYYRIRADVGWQVPNEKDQQFISACNKRGLSAADIKNAIVKMNKSFYLTMVEHDLDFDKTGTVTVTGEYRAYIESELKTTKFDALSDPKIAAARHTRERKLATAKKTCTPGEIAQLKSIFNGQEKAEVRTVQKRIINKLYEKNKIFNLTVLDDGGFRETGTFTKMPEYNTGNNSTTPNSFEDVQSRDAKAFNPEDPENNIQFFYLGDLFYIILDSMYGESGEPKIDKTKFILPSIEIEAYLSGETGYTINVAEIPISIDYFKEWYTQTVVKPERKSYAIMYFIRDLLNNLVVDALIDTCLNRDYNKSFRFNSTTISTKGDVLSGKASSTNSGATQGNYIINIADPNNADLFPLTVETETGEPADITDLVTYVFIMPVYNTITNKGLGNYFDDVKRGVYHFEIGTDRGILNEIKFSKIDMEYIREARFEQSRGVDDLLQLAAVYKASLKLFGNTLFYPGMTLFINPFGIGGLDFIPSDPNSIANKLGLGGYHLVTRVSSIISNGSFKTDVEAMFVYPGDGITRALVQGNNQPKDGTEDNIETPSTDSESGFCDNLLTREADYLRELAFDSQIQGDSITQSVAETPDVTINNPPAQQTTTLTLQEPGTVQTVTLDDGSTVTYASTRDDGNFTIYIDQQGNEVAAVETNSGAPPFGL
jgi:hypothetical protein